MYLIIVTYSSIIEIRIAINVDDYPLKVKHQERNDSRVSTRADTKEKPIEIGKSLLAQKTCVSDAIGLWNMAPELITKSISLSQAKTEIKSLLGTCRSSLILKSNFK